MWFHNNLLHSLSDTEFFLFCPSIQFWSILKDIFSMHPDVFIHNVGPHLLFITPDDVKLFSNCS